MEVSTRKTAMPGKPAGGAPEGWRRFREGLIHFLESIGEILHGMDKARQAHPIISSCRYNRR